LSAEVLPLCQTRQKFAIAITILRRYQYFKIVYRKLNVRLIESRSTSCRPMDEVAIAEYNPNWVLSFEQESACIQAVLDRDFVTRIEHFGSTAIPGLAAKPIIDILIGVRSLAEAKQIAVSQLEQLGYAYWLENPDPQRMFFVKGLPPNSPRTHHIHIVEPDSVLWERLIFRDYLCQHPDEAARYAQLKYDLAQRFSSDREAYTAGKAEYINSVMQKARRLDK
jgi:GrpB-like predicted nucleotidyltransferase (UPF0157 family)